jgi:hypothetical protein
VDLSPSPDTADASVRFSWSWCEPAVVATGGDWAVACGRIALVRALVVAALALTASTLGLALARCARPTWGVAGADALVASLGHSALWEARGAADEADHARPGADADAASAATAAPARCSTLECAISCGTGEGGGGPRRAASAEQRALWGSVRLSPLGLAALALAVLLAIGMTIALVAWSDLIVFINRLVGSGTAAGGSPALFVAAPASWAAAGAGVAGVAASCTLAWADNRAAVAAIVAAKERLAASDDGGGGLGSGWVGERGVAEGDGGGGSARPAGLSNGRLHVRAGAGGGGDVGAGSSSIV